MSYYQTTKPLGRCDATSPSQRTDEKVGLGEFLTHFAALRTVSTNRNVGMTESWQKADSTSRG